MSDSHIAIEDLKEYNRRIDAGMMAAAAVLTVAVIAFIIALVQVIQQYLVTSQLIRICDTIVYGKMLGQGHRMWEFSQFRFRVV